MRESPSLEIMRQLLQRGGDVVFCDDWVPDVELDGREHHTLPWSAETVRDADCVVVLTPHTDFLEQPLWDDAKLIVDTRNVVPLATTAVVTRI
jgi:UDP-N-acetyl-D-glucosamine dehydrogenase